MGGACLALVSFVHAAELPPQTVFYFGARTIQSDKDGDGMSDDYESLNGLDPNDPGDALQDLDGDGLSNVQESNLGSNPWMVDSDADGVTDAEESALALNPLHAGDSDADGLRDDWERFFFGTLSQTSAGDHDGDGLSNIVEAQQGSDPTLQTLPDIDNFAGLTVSRPES